MYGCAVLDLLGGWVVVDCWVERFRGCIWELTALVMTGLRGHRVFLGGFGESDVCAFEVLQFRGDRLDFHWDLGLMYV